MDEKEVVRLFLDRGFQLSNEALPLVLEDSEFILHNLDLLKPRPFLITVSHVEKIFKKQEIPSIKTINELTPIKKPVTTDDYFKDLLSVFESIKSVLITNKSLDKLISINKITEKTNEFSAIGM